MSKIFLIALFVLSSCLGAYYLLPSYQENRNIRRQLESTNEQLLKNQESIDRRRRLVNDLNHSPEAVARVAREKFGLCRSKERVYKFTDEELLESADRK